MSPQYSGLKGRHIRGMITWIILRVNRKSIVMCADLAGRIIVKYTIPRPDDLGYYVTALQAFQGLAKMSQNNFNFKFEHLSKKARP